MNEKTSALAAKYRFAFEDNAGYQRLIALADGLLRLQAREGHRAGAQLLELLRHGVVETLLTVSETWAQGSRHQAIHGPCARGRLTAMFPIMELARRQGCLSPEAEQCLRRECWTIFHMLPDGKQHDAREDDNDEKRN